MPTIKFTDVTGLVPDIFKPVPSKFHMPEWLKNLSPYEERNLPSAKRCLPMVDAVMFGYTILLEQDINVSTRDGSIYYEWQYGDPIEWHPPAQASTHAAVKTAPIPKIMSSWAIDTPSGYSCLFTQPMNLDKPIIKIFDGVVDTDKYCTPVNFPFLFVDPEWRGILPAGMPIAQVMPFKREAWNSEYPIADAKEVARKERFVQTFFKGGYRKMFRADKSFR